MNNERVCRRGGRGVKGIRLVERIVVEMIRQQDMI
jgi:hypothetical protein